MYLHGAGHRPALKMQPSPFMYDVMIWSSQKLILEGWTAFLGTQDRLNLVGQGNPRHETLIVIKSIRPNVILLDIDLPWPEVSAAFSLITSIPRHTSVICVASQVNSVLLLQLKGLGVKGCVSKQATLHQLLTVVYRVCHGLTWYAPPEDAIPAIGLNDSFGNYPILTKREVEVARCLVYGMTSSGIAGRLGINLRTVQVHRHNILKKLKCKNTTTLVNFLMSHQVP